MDQQQVRGQLIDIGVYERDWRYQYPVLSIKGASIIDWMTVFF